MEKDIVKHWEVVVIKGELNGSDDLTTKARRSTIQLKAHVLDDRSERRIKAQGLAQSVLSWASDRQVTAERQGSHPHNGSVDGDIRLAARPPDEPSAALRATASTGQSKGGADAAARRPRRAKPSDARRPRPRGARSRKQQSSAGRRPSSA